jgi:hypothetical protein
MFNLKKFRFKKFEFKNIQIKKCSDKKMFKSKVVKNLEKIRFENLFKFVKILIYQRKQRKTD